MSPREYDESDARVRPSRSTRPRSKDRPSHSDAISALVTTVDRGRQTCITENGTIVTAMRARELGPKSVVTGDNVSIVGDVTGADGSLARIVAVQDRRNSLSRTVDDAAQVERTIVANIDQLVIVVAAANPEPRRGLIDRFLVSAFTEGIIPKIVVTKTDISEVPTFLAEYADLEAETVSWCREMLRNSPLALRLLKASLNAADDGLAGVQQLAGDATLLFYMTEEGQEGRDAYKEKRAPDFGQFPKRP